MTRKLEEFFDLPPSGSDPQDALPPTVEQTQAAMAQADETMDKIDAALPAVRGLDSSDAEMDELANMAKESYNNLMDLGMQVDSRYASEIFAVAGAMLGHALTAKTAKLNKKLKMIDLQLKKTKLDFDHRGGEPTETAHGQVLSRNDLLERLIGNRDQKNKDA
jgi:trimethylamine:corrinoid methyltransferase-like protein